MKMIYKSLAWWVSWDTFNGYTLCPEAYGLHGRICTVTVRALALALLSQHCRPGTNKSISIGISISTTHLAITNNG